MHRARLLATAGLLALGVSACSKDTPSTPGHEAAVTASDTACTLAQAELSA